MFHSASTRACAVILLCASTLSLAAEGEAWIADANGCLTWNPSPVPNETVTWSGGCRDGYMDGRGTLQWFQVGNLTGVLETTMIRGKASGQSTWNDLKTKTSYEGGYLNGRAHGFGQMRWVEKRQRFIGEFWEGKKHGLGTFYFDAGERQEGSFKDDKSAGPVTVTLPTGDRIIASASPETGNLSGPGTRVFPDGTRVDTMFDGSENGNWLLGAKCRETYKDGDYIVGTIQINRKDGKRYCTKSRGAKLAEFLTEMATFGATVAVNAYAIDNGVVLAPGTDPFSALNQISQMQMARAAAMRSSPPPAPMPVAASLSAEAQIAALQEQLRQQQEMLASMQTKEMGTQQGPYPRLPQQQLPQAPAAPPQRAVQQPAQRPVTAPAQEAPLPSNCVQHASGHGLNDLQVNVANNCGETVNVNVCVRIDGDIGTRTNARQMRGGTTTQFSFFSPDKKPYQYQLRFCRPGGTTATNNCPAPCP